MMILWLSLSILLLILVIMLIATMALRRWQSETRSLIGDIGSQYLRLEGHMSTTISQEMRRVGIHQGSQARASQDEPLHLVDYGAWQEGRGQPTNLHSDAGALIREINHGLNTPLAQIELTMMRIQDDSNAESINDSIAICRAVLASYRDVASIMGQANAWDLADLRVSLRGAAQVYLSHRNMQDPPTAHIESPKRPDTYLSNYYLLTIILPLLQNAIEATGSGGRVICKVSEGETIRIEIRNPCTTQPDMSKIRESGYTTRGQEHSGLGLTSVTTLLDRVPTAKLSLTYRGGFFSAVAEIPRRSAEYVY